ncbi:hypothetical protein ACLNGM_17010 [Aureimonas phyllosphaerae]|uniref:hypothetical protein n=1 Tax=Aureimonas phyllosphaerae TaxID=1166078 RepID=UPI003A5C6CEB
MTWFEKTVEYKYVIRSHLHEGIIPFAGPTEKLIGDAITKGNGEFRILEFKRSADTRSSEWLKYPATHTDASAKDRIKSAGRAFEKEFGKSNFGHYMIYGEEIIPIEQKKFETGNSHYPHFRLINAKYWDFDSSPTSRSVSLRSFKDVLKLQEYLQFLARNRVEWTASSGSEEMVEARRGGFVTYLTLSEFQRSLELALIRAHVIEDIKTIASTPKP